MTSMTRRRKWNALLFSLAVIGVAFGTWRVHHSRVEAAAAEALLFRDLYEMGMIANVLAVRAQGREDRLDALLDRYLDSPLDSADALTREGTSLGGEFPNVLDGLRRVRGARPGDPAVGEKVERISRRLGVGGTEAR